MRRQALLLATALAYAAPAVAATPVAPDMVAIAAGKFVMGSSQAETDKEKALTHHTGNPIDDDYAIREKPLHAVSVRAFEIGRNMVTMGEFAQFVQDTGYQAKGCYAYAGTAYAVRAEADWQSTGFPQSDRHPVTCVNFADATAYIAWFSKKTGKTYRLPSEAEFEYATRAGTTTSRYWGDDIKLQCTYANGADLTVGARDKDWVVAPCHDDYYGPSPVGTFAPNPWGLYDMIGNLYQLTADCWHETYEGAPTDGSAWVSKDCKLHAIRGGSHSPHPGSMRSASRVMQNEIRSVFVGFRLARSLP